MPNPFALAVRAQTKGVTFTPATAAWEFFNNSRLPGSDVNFASEVHNGMRSSVVTSALCWMMRTFPEAPLVTQKIVEEKWETVPRHGMTELLRRPNPEYNSVVLWQATIADFCFGEAYWLKVRNGFGDVVELWWVPRSIITPRANPDTGRLMVYDYRPGTYTEPMLLDPDDVVHFRFGRDPNNILRGFSPLAAVMREVYTDDQAANFTAAILKNMGVIGVILSPKKGAGVIPKENLKEMKAEVQQNFTGDKRGSAMLMSGSMEAQVLQYNLSGFDVGPIRDIAEERVCAALGIPAAVIGFGTGLQQTKVGATMREMVKLAWQGGIEPNQRAMADELDRSLLTEFQKRDTHFRSHFDTSQVEALTESPSEKTDRVLKLVEGNVIKYGQAQRELGYPVDSAVKDKYARELAPAKAPSLPVLPTEPSNRVQDNQPAGT
jgi:HK97 family phage portal protein